MHRLALVAILAFATLSTVAVEAKEEEGQNYVVPMATGVWVDDDRLLDDDVGFHLGIGRAVSETWNAEFNFTGSNHDGFPGADFRGIGVDALRVFYRDGLISPFLLLGAGHLETDFDGTEEDDSNIAGNFGVGFLTDFGDSAIALRTEVRMRGGFGEGNDVVAGIGLHFPFGEKAAPPPPSEPLDSDGDGVPDDRDRCPDTPAGAEVNDDGCEPDADGDGVPDSRDRCPGTPAGVEVNDDGCEVDTDGDGVVDSRDRCPDTPSGVRVDVNGCELTEEIRLRDVHFAFDSAEILPGAERALDDAAATLSRYPDLVVEVAGHTDSQGAEAYNQDLSRRRAESVRSYLVDNGVEAGNLTAEGYGETQPVADNDTEEGREDNRRVVLRILNANEVGIEVEEQQ